MSLDWDGCHACGSTLPDTRWGRRPPNGNGQGRPDMRYLWMTIASGAGPRQGVDPPSDTPNATALATPSGCRLNPADALSKTIAVIPSAIPNIVHAGACCMRSAVPTKAPGAHIGALTRRYLPNGRRVCRAGRRARRAFASGRRGTRIVS